MSRTDINKNEYIPIIHHEQKVSILKANINALKEEISGYVKYRKSREGELDQLRKENERLREALGYALIGLEAVYMPYAEYVIKTKEAINAEQGGE